MLNLLNEAIRLYVNDKHGEGGWDEIRTHSWSQSSSQRHSQYIDTLVEERLTTESSSNVPELAREVIIVSAKILGEDESTAMEEFGRKFFHCCLKQKRKILHSLGTTLCDFLNNIDNLYLLFGSEDEYDLLQPPTFNCVVKQDNCQLVLHYYSSRQGWEFFIKGAVKYAAEVLFSSSVYIKVLDKEESFNQQQNCKLSDGRTHSVFEIWQTCKGHKLNPPSSKSSQDAISVNPNDLNISIYTLSAMFPFHIIFDDNLEIQQLGVLLFRLIGSKFVTRGKKIDTHFEFVRPAIAPDFYSIICRINSLFYIRLKPHRNGVEQKLLELKGQMIHLPEADSVLFVGSPIVASLEQLQGRGLFLSDIPIHDATRDLMLVSEQALAQDTLKKRMEQLKHQLQQTSNELAHEKRKTEEILESVFPHDVAKMLTHKQPVPARFIDNVTMLFSDIVGFTSICSRCAPMEVVEILNSLYTKFDKLCGELDLYKVETIGDAYVVAGGLQGSSGTADDAQKVARMGLGMIAAMKDETTPGGIPIQIRVGIHTGSVLSGVVGTKMPRYCLFGHNVTVANKMETNSEPNCVNISPVTLRFLRECKEFTFIPRPGHLLPGSSLDSGVATDVCHFLQYIVPKDTHNSSTSQQTPSQQKNDNLNKDRKINCVLKCNNFDITDRDLHQKCTSNNNNNNKINDGNTLKDASTYEPSSELNPWVPFPCRTEQRNCSSAKQKTTNGRETKLSVRDVNEKKHKWHSPPLAHIKKHTVLPCHQGNCVSTRKHSKETTV